MADDSSSKPAKKGKKDAAAPTSDVPAGASPAGSAATAIDDKVLLMQVEYRGLCLT